MKGEYAYSIEVPITNFTTQGQNKFNDLASNSLLNPATNKDVIPVIVGVESFFSSFYAFSTSNRPVVTQADAANLAVTFNVDNDEPYYQVPYLDFATILNYGLIREIFPSAINLQKSYVIVQQTLAVNNPNSSAIFNFWYIRPLRKDWPAMHEALRERQKKGLPI